MTGNNSNDDLNVYFFLHTELIILQSLYILINQSILFLLVFTREWPKQNGRRPNRAIEKDHTAVYGGMGR